jgi:hypothetical protein
MEKIIPVLTRERFIADTLYKKLWIHDSMPCPYRTWLFVFLSLWFAVVDGWDSSSKKVLGYILMGVFLCLAVAMKKD